MDGRTMTTTITATIATKPLLPPADKPSIAPLKIYALAVEGIRV